MQIIPNPNGGDVFLHEVLSADYEAGKLFWLARSVDLFAATDGRTAEHSQRQWNDRYAGRPAMTALDGSGYRMGRIFSKPYKAHRVIYAMHHGQWPEPQADHINGIRTDNRISNLREVTQSENNMNLRAKANNKSGHVGVCWDNNRSKWLATVMGSYIGRYDHIEDAVLARSNSQENFRFTERHGK